MPSKGGFRTKDAMDDAFAVSKLVKFSTKKQQTGEVDAIICSGITRLAAMLCPTCWTVRAASLMSILPIYVALEQLSETVKDSTTDPNFKGRIIGVQYLFKTFGSSLE